MKCLLSLSRQMEHARFTLPRAIRSARRCHGGKKASRPA